MSNGSLRKSNSKLLNRRTPSNNGLISNRITNGRIPKQQSRTTSNVQTLRLQQTSNSNSYRNSQSYGFRNRTYAQPNSSSSVALEGFGDRRESHASLPPISSRSSVHQHRHFKPAEAPKTSRVPVPPSTQRTITRNNSEELHYYENDDNVIYSSRFQNFPIRRDLLQTPASAAPEIPSIVNSNNSRRNSLSFNETASVSTVVAASEVDQITSENPVASFNTNRSSLLQNTSSDSTINDTITTTQNEILVPEPSNLNILSDNEMAILPESTISEETFQNSIDTSADESVSSGENNSTERPFDIDSDVEGSDNNEEDNNSVAQSAMTFLFENTHVAGTELILLNQRQILENLLETYIVLMLSLQNQESSAHNGLDAKSIEDLPRDFVTHSQVEERSTCTICLIPFELEEKITNLSCSHYFHHPCIGEWLKKSASCPVCRIVVEPSEEKTN